LLTLLALTERPVDCVERHCTEEKRKAEAQSCRNNYGKVIPIRERIKVVGVDTVVLRQMVWRMRLQPTYDFFWEEVSELFRAKVEDICSEGQRERAAPGQARRHHFQGNSSCLKVPKRQRFAGRLFSDLVDLAVQPWH
jgi:hypothetical protein